MNTVQQLCVSSIYVHQDFSIEQGRTYTTSVPTDDTDKITVFTRFWVKVPKENFVLSEEKACIP